MKSVVNDMASIRGQWHVARALEVAAAGRHNLVLSGSPGVGKAMLASTLPTLLPEEPPLSLLQAEDEEEIPEQGILFFKDIHEWRTRDLTRLWQPRPTLQMIATMQPCPCGYYGDPLIECTCPAQRIAHHQRSLAPFLHEFDIHVEVPRVKPEDLLSTRKRESSQLIRQRVEKAFKAQEQRGSINVAITTIEQAQEDLDSSAEKLLRAALSQLHMTPRQTIQTLRVARTIADLAASKEITASSLAEAIQYRPRISRG